jgi:hypothetical protein
MNTNDLKEHLRIPTPELTQEQKDKFCEFQMNMLVGLLTQTIGIIQKADVDTFLKMICNRKSHTSIIVTPNVTYQCSLSISATKKTDEKPTE